MTQLSVLLKKQVWVQKRRIGGTLCELLFPIILTLLAAFSMRQIQKLQEGGDTLLPWLLLPSPVANVGNSYAACAETYGANCIFGIVPENISSIPILPQILSRLKEQMRLSNMTNTWQYFPSNDALSQYYLNNSEKIWAGVIFSQDPFPGSSNALGTTGSLYYTIRMNASYLPPKAAGPCDLSSIGNIFASVFDNRYNSSGFLGLQNMIETSFISEKISQTSGKAAFEVSMSSQFGYGPNRFLSSFQCFLGLFAGVVISWGYIPLIIVPLTEMVREKNSKLKELMLLMGLKQSAYWWSWIIWLSVPNAIVSISLAIICGPAIGLLQYSSIFCLFLVFLSFGISIITFSFLLSSLVKSPGVGGGLGFIWIYIFGSFAFYVTSSTASIQYLASIISPVGFILTYSRMLDLEMLHVGLKMDTIMMGDVPVLGFVLVMFGDSVLYALLGWYFNQLFPGDSGVGQPFYFIFLPRYWCDPRRKKHSNSRRGGRAERDDDDSVSGKGGDDILIYNEDDHADEENATAESPLLLDVALQLETSTNFTDASHFENFDVSDSSHVGVEIKALTKIYEVASSDGNETCTRAVDHLKDKLFKGQIYALLGRNGAGKSTTIAMLTGMTAPTGGDAVVGGHSIITNMDAVRNIIGFCPQESILYNSLTVEEHLLLFGELRGIPSHVLSAQITQILTELELTDKRGEIVKELSGGMKRRLSLAIAFLGDPEVVFLDEPTSGLDPVSRRKIWDLLKKKKKGRTIILTTHFMEEADILGDRIAIMSNGKLKCCGTSTFLKRQFGTGYYLHITRKRHGKKTTSSASSTGNTNITSSDSEIMDFIKTMIPSAAVHGVTEDELTVLLPMEFSGKLSGLCKNLEDVAKKLGVLHYGVSMTSLEDVFLQITKKDEEDHFQNMKRSDLGLSKFGSGDGALVVKTLMNDEDKEEFDPPTSCSQFMTLTWYIFMNDLRNWKATLFFILLPILLLTLSNVNANAVASQLQSSLGNQRDVFTPISIASVLPISLPFLTETPETVSEVFNVFSEISRQISLKFLSFNSSVNYQSAVLKDYSGAMAHGGLKFGSNFNYPYGALSYQYPYTLLFNTSDHSSTILEANIVSNGILSYWEAIYNVTNKSSISIGVQPFPSSVLRKSFTLGLNINVNAATNNQNVTNFLVSIAIGMAVMGGVLASRVVTLKQLKIKFLLHLSTVDLFNFYMSHYVSYCMFYFISVAGIWIVFASFSLTAFTSTNFVPVFLLSILFIFSIVAINLVFSTFFNDGSSSIKFLIGLNVFSVALPYIISTALSFATKTNPAIKSYTNYLPCFSPISAFVGGLNDIWTVVLNDPTTSTPPLASFFAFSSNLPLRFIAMTIHIILSVVLIYVIEVAQYIRKPPPRRGSDPGVDLNDLDTDVLRERLRISQGPIPTGGEFQISDGRPTTTSATTASTTSSTTSQGEPQKPGLTKQPQPTRLDVSSEISVSASLSSSGNVPLTKTPKMKSGNLDLIVPDDMARRKTKEKPLDEQEETLSEVSEIKEAKERGKGRGEGEEKSFLDDYDEADAEEVVVVKDAVRLVDLGKRYKNDMIAVEGVSLGIKYGECFGLLGPNGAGKTTTISMLTAELQPSFGDAFLDDFSISTPKSELFRSISVGCCLQENAIFPHLTVKDHFYLYYKLKHKVTQKQADRRVWALIHMLHLESYAGRQASKLSGGNKRKLCVGISILSGNRIIFMDEPSTGMDPSSRRALWKIIADQTVKRGNAVVLTTHSMEESENVCDRIGIMVKGQLKCLGTTQHLKNRFGNSYRLVITALNQAQVPTIHSFIVEKFPQAKVLEQFGSCVTFTLGTIPSLAKAFQRLEENQAKLGIQTYSLSQTSLEQLFMYFAREQDDQQQQQPQQQQLQLQQPQVDQNQEVAITGPGQEDEV